MTCIGNRAGDRRRPKLRRLLSHADDAFFGLVFFIKVLEVAPVLADHRLRRTARILSLRESAQSFEDVSRPADGLAELSVADDVDTGVDLATHDLLHRGPQAFIERRVVVAFATLLFEEESYQLRWTDQAANMCGLDRLRHHRTSRCHAFKARLLFCLANISQDSIACAVSAAREHSALTTLR
jgi:hypothetical protein